MPRLDPFLRDIKNLVPEQDYSNICYSILDGIIREHYFENNDPDTAIKGIRKMQDKGIDINCIREDTVSVGYYAEDVTETIMYEYIHTGDIRLIGILLDLGSDPNINIDALQAMPGAIQHLFRYGRDDFLSGTNKSVKLIKLFIDNGQELNPIDSRDSREKNGKRHHNIFTPLEYACFYPNNPDLVLLFIQELVREGAVVSFGDDKLILIIAERMTNLPAENRKEIVKGYIKVLEFLIENGASKTTKDNKGNTPYDLINNTKTIRTKKLLDMLRP